MVVNMRVLLRHLFRRPDAALANLEEVPARRQHRKALRDKCIAERIEHRIHPAPACFLQDVFREVGVARVVDVLHANRLQVAAFDFATRGGKDLRAQALGQAHRGQSYAAGGGMDQHALTGLQVGQVMQAVPGGQEGGWHRGGFGKAQRMRLVKYQFGFGDQMRTESPRAQRDHKIAGVDALDALSHGGDHAGAFVAQRYFARVHPQYV